MQLTVTKRYDDIPFAHRQHRHDGHCAQIHGHNWSFEFEFAARKLDATGFVVDFGKLKVLRDTINNVFDHALVLNEDDPLLEHLESVLGTQEAGEDMDTPPRTVALARIVTVPNCSCEGLCAYLFALVTELLQVNFKGRVFLTRITVIEDSRNSATLRLPE